MSPIEWSEDLSVNIQEIDLQHRQLVALVGDLEKALDTGADKQIMGRVIRELNVYVRDHFTTEERWMRRHEFPELDAHAREHEVFVDKLLHFELDHLSGRAEVSAELLDYLAHWFETHVSGYDRQYAKFFQEKGVV